MTDLLKIIDWKFLSVNEKQKILLRPIILDSNNIVELVQKIIIDVKNVGDDALKKYTNDFDNQTIDHFQISEKKILSSYNKVHQNVKNAIAQSAKNITKFHLAQQINEIDVNIDSGIRCQSIVRPIESVGLYIPGGTAPLLSTVLMLAIPANIAKCLNIVICSPPPIIDEILYTAKICGVHKIFQIGGAQAIAALAFGTESIPKVNKIFGPGNIYVTEAKKQVLHNVNDLAIDMLAGPSELLIIADEHANPIFIASDLLAQAEHGLNSQVILLTPSVKLAQLVLININMQLMNLPRCEIIKNSLKNSYAIITDNIKECIQISNLYAPEHLIIHTVNARELLINVINAGSVFLGSWSPESAGDYASGTNHVLPTYGCATTYSGLSLMDFQKRISVQELTKQGLINLASTINTLSDLEKMEAHKNSVNVRLKHLQEII
ncbi:MAG TPA: histidinol dehydrogenase [Buchnera sp. (in: enterobacteria)]|nr:histidinol dehydrogenase [Buchnera sp. (in: enterobacteria)]